MAELNIAQPMRFRVDVKTGLVEQPLRESLMKGDKKANRIIAEIVNGGVPQDITGVTVKGKFCRPPDFDEIELSGTAEGNLAIVQLTDACYAQSGNYQATVSLVLDDVERTVLFISSTVLRSGSGNAVGEDAGGGSGTGSGSSTGSGLPSGGTAGQVLVKVTAASGDASWKTLTATDVKARPDTWMPTAEEVGALPSTTEIPTVPSALPNPQPIVINGISYDGSEKKEITIQADGGGIATETDPTVPAWAKNPTKPTYTADEVGALAEDAQAADSAKLGGKTWAERLLEIYPVGSIYMSVNDTSPAALFGGTWEQLKDRFLLGAGSSYAAGSTGGEAEHTLTVDEMPNHYHNLPFQTGNSGGSVNGGYIAYASGLGGSTYTTSYTGGSAAHNNMPPYLTVYVWKRVS